MFKVGVIHSLIVTVSLVVLMFVLTFLGAQEQYVELSIYFVFIIAVMSVGYRFKHKTGISPFDALINKDLNYLLLYPLGLAVFPALFKVIDASSEYDVLALIPMYPVSLISLSLSFGTQLLMGSFFCRKVST